MVSVDMSSPSENQQVDVEQVKIKKDKREKKGKKERKEMKEKSSILAGLDQSDQCDQSDMDAGKKRKGGSDDLEAGDSKVFKKNKKEKKDKRDKKSKKEAFEATTEDQGDHEHNDQTAQKEVEKQVSSYNTDGTWKYVESAKLAEVPQSQIDAFFTENTIAIQGEIQPRPILDFSYTSFPSELVNGVFKSFDKPTPIQAATWPIAFQGHDVIGIAKTGSGKTLSFGIPAILKLAKKGLTRPKSGRPRVVILSPTRELACQIHDQLVVAGAPFDVNSVCIYGGVSKMDQKDILRKGIHILVATPGRLVDLMNEQSVMLQDVDYLVLDEADRMLDLGFDMEVKTIIGACKPKHQRQTVMFSATWPKSVRDLAHSYMCKPITVTVGNSNQLTANESIKQIVEVLEPHQKDQKLIDLLNKYHNRTNRVLVFVLYKKEATRVENAVRRAGWKCGSIHGDKSQKERTESITNFRDGSNPLLIATDVAARGLDIPDVEYVINYTFPLTVEEYCHRIGRTGRAGKTGCSHTLFTVYDKAHSGSLINVLKAAKQVVPNNLLKFGTTVKKKEHKEYGAFYKDVDPNVKGTKISFGSDDDE